MSLRTDFFSQGVSRCVSGDTQFLVPNSILPKKGHTTEDRVTILFKQHVENRPDTLSTYNDVLSSFYFASASLKGKTVFCLVPARASQKSLQNAVETYSSQLERLGEKEDLLAAKQLALSQVSNEITEKKAAFASQIEGRVGALEADIATLQIEPVQKSSILGKAKTSINKLVHRKGADSVEDPKALAIAEKQDQIARLKAGTFSCPEELASHERTLTAEISHLKEEIEFTRNVARPFLLTASSISQAATPVLEKCFSAFVPKYTMLKEEEMNLQNLRLKRDSIGEYLAILSDKFIKELPEEALEKLFAMQKTCSSLGYQITQGADFTSLDSAFNSLMEEIGLLETDLTQQAKELQEAEQTLLDDLKLLLAPIYQSSLKDTAVAEKVITFSKELSKFKERLETAVSLKETDFKKAAEDLENLKDDLSRFLRIMGQALYTDFVASSSVISQELVTLFFKHLNNPSGQQMIEDLNNFYTFSHLPISERNAFVQEILPVEESWEVVNVTNDADSATDSLEDLPRPEPRPGYDSGHA